MDDFDPGGAVCPPVVAYDQALRERAAAELDALPPDATLVGMMADYAVMRAQRGLRFIGSIGQAGSDPPGAVRD